MAKTAWRCSQCGTVNEAGAHACRECGRWPSLFDLQDSAVEEAELAEPRESAFEVHELEPETFEPIGRGPDEPEAEVPRRRRLASALLPLALLVYFLISFFRNAR